MTSRSNWENKLLQNPPSATERLKAALSRPVNEAIKVDAEPKTTPSSTQTYPDSKQLGDGAAARAARAMRKGTTDKIE